MSLGYRIISTAKYYAKKSAVLRRGVKWLRARATGHQDVGKALHRDGLAFASKAQTLLLERGIPCGLCSGSLLGVIREGGLLPHDDDLDFIVLLAPGFSWTTVEEALSGIGSRLEHSFELDGTIVEQTYDSGLGFNFDIFGARDLGDADNLQVYYFAQKADRVYDDRDSFSVWYLDIPRFETMIEYSVGGMTILVPENPERFLVANYGPNWRVPDSGWSTKKALTELDGVTAIRRRR